MTVEIWAIHPFTSKYGDSLLMAIEAHIANDGPVSGNNILVVRRIRILGQDKSI